MTDRLPTHGEAGWDAILDGFLEVEHNPDGTHKTPVVVAYLDQYIATGSYANHSAALQAAIDAVAATRTDGRAGGYVIAGPNVYTMYAPVAVANRVVVRGQGHHTTQFKADATFAGGTKMFTLGTNADVFGTRIEETSINCNGVVAEGVYSEWCQENCGLRNFNVTQFTSIGVHFTTTGVQNVGLYGGEIYGGTDSSSATEGILFDHCAGQLFVENVTVNANNNSFDMTNGIRVKQCNLTVRNFHVENCTLGGINVDTAATLSADTVAGVSSVANVIYFNGLSAILSSIDDNGAAVTVYDATDPSATLTGHVDFAVLGPSRERIHFGGNSTNYKKPLRYNTPAVMAGGVASVITAGAPTDAAFPTTPPTGTFAVDTTNGKIYVRIDPTLLDISATHTVSGHTYSSLIAVNPSGTVAHRASASATTGTTGCTVAVPTGTANGDIMLAIIMVSFAAATITTPSGWTLLDTKNVDGLSASTYYRVAGSSEPANYTWTGSHTNMAGAISSFSGGNTSTPISAHGAMHHDNSTTALATAISPTANTCMMVFLSASGAGGNDTWTPPTGFTELVDAHGSGSSVTIASLLQDPTTAWKSVTLS